MTSAMHGVVLTGSRPIDTIRDLDGFASVFGLLLERRWRTRHTFWEEIEK
jgi:hypothetical protein